MKRQRCPGFGDLCLLADGELDKQRREELGEHVAHCANCAGRLGEIRMLDAALAGSIAVDVRRRSWRPALLGGFAALLCSLVLMWPKVNAPETPRPERSLAFVYWLESPLRLAEVRELMRDESAGMPGAEERLRAQGSALVRMLDSPYSEDALAALDLLVRFRDEDAAGSIVPLLERPELEYEAVLALGELGKPAALPALSSRFAHSAAADEIAIAIGRIGGVPARHALETLLQQEREEQRRALLLGQPTRDRHWSRNANDVRCLATDRPDQHLAAGEPEFAGRSADRSQSGTDHVVRVAVTHRLPPGPLPGRKPRGEG